MANYNTFVIQDTRTRKILLVTSSARKARSEFAKGRGVEVWNGNAKLERFTVKDLKREKNPLAPYVESERRYIAEKQAQAEKKNKRSFNYVQT